MGKISNLTKTQKERYLRNIMLEDVGEEGQKKLLSSSVLIIGAGGLGSPVALYLAAAGIGKIGICDGDVVDITNLQRQIIHNTNDIGVNKTKSAREKLNMLNGDVEIETYPCWIDSKNISKIIKIGRAHV